VADLRGKWRTILKAAPRQQKKQLSTISRHASPRGGFLFHAALCPFEIALVFERLDDIASSVVNANRDGMHPAVRLCVAHCIDDRV